MILEKWIAWTKAQGRAMTYLGRQEALTTSTADIRKIALALNGASEIDHWGRPAFRTKKRIFAVIRSDGLFLHLPDERKEFLFEADPKTFVKFMWGKRSNVIVQPEKISRRELAALFGEAHAHASPPQKSAPAKKEGGRSRPRKPSRGKA
jgi:hypothetical protein